MIKRAKITLVLLRSMYSLYSFALTFPSEMSGFRDNSLGKLEIEAQMSIYSFALAFPSEMSGLTRPMREHEPS
jgi:hypothetical protein